MKIEESLSDRIDKWISFGLKILLLIGAILEAINGYWMNTILILGILFAAFIPLLLGYKFNVVIPPEFELLAVIFVCASLFLGEIYNFYEKYWWWDILLHMSSGLILGIFGFLLVYVINEHDDLNLHMKPSFVGLFAFMFSLSMGTIWEITEFTLDQTLGMNTQHGSLTDTMSDLIVDAIGALIIAILGYRYLLTPQADSFLERWIQHYINLNQKYFPNRNINNRKHKNE